MRVAPKRISDLDALTFRHPGRVTRDLGYKTVFIVKDTEEYSKHYQGSKSITEKGGGASVLGLVDKGLRQGYTVTGRGGGIPRN